MVILRNFKNIFFVPELRKKLLFTLGILIVYRIGIFIPVIGVDSNVLGEIMRGAGRFSGLLKYIDLFSAGALTNCTLFALGIMPYITASLMMQILSFSFPSLERLMKEGEFGRKMINQYTRYLALGLSVMYGSLYAGTLELQGAVIEPGWAFRLLFIVSLTTGSMVVMWLGDQISLSGIGNGSSVIIFAGIVSRFPEFVMRTIHAVQVGKLDIILAFLIWIVLIVIIGCIVFLEKGDRKIPIQHARRVVGNRIYAAQSTYIPFKINNAGVMPAILAGTVLTLPVSIIGFLAERLTFMQPLANMLSGSGFFYNLLQFFLIIFFYFFYTALAYNPTELADNLKKSGGFIPGIRPGRKTAEFLEYVLDRLGLVGAIYLGLLSMAPYLMSLMFSMPFILGGTSLLIVVGVALESSSQIESFLIEHNYEGFLTSGTIKARRP